VCSFSIINSFTRFCTAVTWQLGLVEREINELLRGITVQQETRVSHRNQQRQQLPETSPQVAEGENAGTVPQREISGSDICPVCQDELLSKHQPVTYCRYLCDCLLNYPCNVCRHRNSVCCLERRCSDIRLFRQPFVETSSVSVFEFNGRFPGVIRKIASFVTTHLKTEIVWKFKQVTW
jgi:hypothetical protein